MTIQAMGTKPREEIVVFAWGENPTEKYGTLLFDAADAIEVMRRYEQRGVLLPWDVEHASRLGGPADWQESHAWSGLKVDHRGLVAVTDYNANGLEKVSSRKFPFDSPVVNRWRGNHVRDVEMFALVKEPARNRSTPLLMSNTSARLKLLQALHSALGVLVDAANAAKSEPDLAPIVDEIAGPLAAPGVRLGELLLQAGGAEQPGKASDPPVSEQSSAQAMLSASAPRDVLAELGASVMSRLGAQSADAALGKLEALLNPGQALMSASGVNHESHALLLSAQVAVKVTADEVDQYKTKSPDFVRAFLSNRDPMVNTTEDRQQSAASEAQVDSEFEKRLNDRINSHKVVR